MAGFTGSYSSGSMIVKPVETGSGIIISGSSGSSYNYRTITWNTSSWFPTPSYVSSSVSSTRRRFIWSAVRVPSSQGAVSGYKIYRGGTVKWTCAVCSSSVTQDDRPSTCPTCGAPPGQFTWAVVGAGSSVNVVAGTTFSFSSSIYSDARDEVFRIATYGTAKSGSKVSYNGTSLPFTVYPWGNNYTFLSGSNISLNQIGKLIPDSETTGSNGGISLSGSIWNQNINAFSKHKPGSYTATSVSSMPYMQISNSLGSFTESGKLAQYLSSASLQILPDSQKLWQKTYGKNNVNWGKAGCLNSFRYYTNTYIAGKLGSSTWLFPWTKLVFAGGDVEDYGLYSASTITGSIGMYVSKTRSTSGDYNFVDWLSNDQVKYQMLTYNSQSWTSSVWISSLADSYVYPGLAWILPQTSSVSTYFPNMALYRSANSLATSGNDVKAIDFSPILKPLVDIFKTSGSYLFPVLFNMYNYSGSKLKDPDTLTMFFASTGSSEIIPPTVTIDDNFIKICRTV